MDELTEEQVRSIRVPVPHTQIQVEAVAQINELVIRSIELRAEAVDAAKQAEVTMGSLLPFMPRYR